jgi:hypothetical protein
MLTPTITDKKGLVLWFLDRSIELFVDVNRLLDG